VSDPAQTAASPVPGDHIRPWLSGVSSAYAAGKSYQIYRGEPSGVGVTVPFPTEAEIGALYASDYDYDAHSLIEGEKRWRNRRLVELVVERGASIQSALDVGCMYGYLLEELRRRGARDVQGVEIAPGPAARAAVKGFAVHCGTIESFAALSPPAAFDILFAQHVLEHVPDPASFLHAAFRLLRPGGKLALAVPHLDSRSRRIFARAWGWYQVPAHLFHFSGPGLAALCQASGFTIERSHRRGGDSLFVLMTLHNAARRSDGRRGPLSPATKLAVRAASLLLRPYLHVGDEELVVIASKPRSSASAGAR
jgi:SAM-dependent methyltransferase